MKYILFIISALLIGCTNSPEKSDTISCLLKIDSIARVQTFREATLTAEICADQFEKDTKLNLRLAELYLLSHLVDNDEKGLGKATDQFSKTLKIDISFATNYKDFNLNEKRLSELSEIWFKIQEDKYEPERERILIWALIEKFDSEKEPKLIK